MCRAGRQVCRAPHPTTLPPPRSSAPPSSPKRNAATNETNGDKALTRAQELTKTLESKVDELEEKNAALVAHCKSIGLLLDSDAGEGGEWLHVVC